ncbi:winged helix-turn-helix domain-containing protein [Patescibacteria group bacterium]|nr:winged helix-turn-helix domain-containing protein [Patescibacteria group bacterium]
MLEHLIGSKTRLKLLQLFYRSQDRSFYVRELARLIGVQLNAVRRELANLERLCIITHVPAGTSKIEEAGTERSKYFKLNSNFLLYNELKNLLFKSQELEEQILVEDLKKKGGKIKFLLLTGLFTGDAEAGTDILIVGEIKAMTVSRLVKEFEQLFGKSIRYTIMDDKEFTDRHEIGDRFLYGVFECKNMVVVDEFNIR